MRSRRGLAGRKSLTAGPKGPMILMRGALDGCAGKARWMDVTDPGDVGVDSVGE